MGQFVSRLETDSEESGEYDTSNSGSSSQVLDCSNCLENDISQLTKVKSKPNEHLVKIVPGKRKRSVSTVNMLAGREANFSGRGRFTSADQCHVASRFLPIRGPWLVDQMNSRAYVSQFSADGSLFVTGFQGSFIRIYNVNREWKVQKNIQAKSLRWTITDTSLSPDQQRLVYSSMSPLVHIVDIGSGATDSLANVTDIHDGLDFSEYGEYGYSFGIFSVKFSTDGRELVAGSSDDAIYVYDLQANKLSLRIPAHNSDVNSVCFADESGHLIISGSDDNLCKVWDRRCFNAREKPAGIMVGHLEGITFIDSRGDGRYFISNGKDQCIKLWDVRKMSSNVNRSGSFMKKRKVKRTLVAKDYNSRFTPKFKRVNEPAPRTYDWDYRWMEYPQQAKDQRHPNDQSVSTYRGHSVLRTLIRCYFSPEQSAGQKYIYSGSNDGSVYIYDLVSGVLVVKLDHHMFSVRDCSWHPNYPMLVSSSWDGTVVKWEFPGNDEMPHSSNNRVIW